MSTYEPKAIDCSIYKRRCTFYFNAASISDSALKSATLLTLICDTAYQMLADLHLPDSLTSIAYDTLITCLDGACGR